MKKIEEYILKNYFSNLKILNSREKSVLLSYIRAFNFLVYENDLRNVLEIGAGHSTLLFSLLSKKFLVASSIKADSNWDIIHFDNTTPQGILIAKK